MDTKNKKEEVNFLDSVLNKLADPVFVKDENYCFVFANDALCNMLGITRENIIGKTLGESLPEDQMEHFLEIDKTVLESGQDNISEEKLTGKEGEILTIVTKKTRFTDQQGKKFLIGVIHDITERKKIENDLRKHNEEAEKLNKLMIGRELEMIELKKELAKIKK